MVEVGDWLEVGLEVPGLVATVVSVVTSTVEALVGIAIDAESVLVGVMVVVVAVPR